MLAKNNILKKAAEYSEIGLIPCMLEQMALFLDGYRCKNMYIDIHSDIITYFILDDARVTTTITQYCFKGIVIEHYDCGNVSSIKTLSHEMINDYIKNKIQQQ